MRKLYNEFFHIPEVGKIREKIMLTRVVTTVATVLLCLGAISFTAYAYFTCNITSSFGQIKSANFEASVSITSNGNPIAVTKEGDDQIANLEAGTYTILLSKGESTAQKGFCTVEIGSRKYYSDQIGVDSLKGLTDATVKFDLVLPTSAKIKISSSWGTSVYYGDEDKTEVFIKTNTTLDLTPVTTGDDEEADDSTDASDEASTEEPEVTPDPSAPQASEGANDLSTEPTDPDDATSPDVSEPTEPDSIEPTEPDSTEPTEPDPTEPTEPETPDSPEPTPDTQEPEVEGDPTEGADE